jgi:hypothetical protein
VLLDGNVEGTAFAYPESNPYGTRSADGGKVTTRGAVLTYGGLAILDTERLEVKSIRI